MTAPDSTPVGAPETARPPKLLDQVRARLRMKHYSLRTEDQYVHWMKRFILFHGKQHPRELGAAEVEAFFVFQPNGIMPPISVHAEC